MHLRIIPPLSSLPVDTIPRPSPRACGIVKSTPLHTAHIPVGKGKGKEKTRSEGCLHGERADGATGGAPALISVVVVVMEVWPWP